MEIKNLNSIKPISIIDIFRENQYDFLDGIEIKPLSVYEETELDLYSNIYLTKNKRYKQLLDKQTKYDLVQGLLCVKVDIDKCNDVNAYLLTKDYIEEWASLNNYTETKYRKFDKNIKIENLNNIKSKIDLISNFNGDYWENMSHYGIINALTILINEDNNTYLLLYEPEIRGFEDLKPVYLFLHFWEDEVIKKCNLNILNKVL